MISSSRFETTAGSTPGFTSALHGQERDILEFLHAGRDADRGLLLAHQRIVEPRAAEAAKDRGCKVELA